MNRIPAANLSGGIPAHLREAAEHICSRLRENKFEAYLVGGCIRDLVLARRVNDVDITTNARPDDLMRIFSHTVPVGVRFGTVLVLYRGIPVEVTTYRHDGDYSDGRRPDSIRFGDSLEEDVIRRDFTMNGLAYDPVRHEILDHVGGMEDIRNRLIRTIGNPSDRFREDGLRPIRGCRFAAALEFQFEAGTEAAISGSLDRVFSVSMERFHDEWKKTLKTRHRVIFWRKLRTNGIFQFFLRDFTTLQSDEGFNRLLALLEKAHPGKMAEYGACFLMASGEGGKTGVKKLMSLKFSRNDAILSEELAHSPLFVNAGKDPRSALSGISRRNRISHLRFFGRLGGTSAEKTVRECIGYIRSRYPLDISDLAVHGGDLEAAGLQGRELGDCLRQLQSAVLADRDLNERDTLLKLVREFQARKST